MKPSRREWLTDTLRSGAFLATTPLRAMPAGAERNLALNRAAYASSACDYIHTGHMATDGQMSTGWSSRDGDAQWIYVVLGATCTLSRVVLRWGRNYARFYRLQISLSPAAAGTGFVEAWTDVYSTSDGKGAVEEISMASAEARFVRLLCQRGGSGGYSLASFEVYGTGATPTPPVPRARPRSDGVLEMADGWKLMSESFIADDAIRISTRGYDDRKWLVATVPGTVLTTYLNVGAIPDPFYGDFQYQVSDWFSRSQWQPLETGDAITSGQAALMLWRIHRGPIAK